MARVKSDDIEWGLVDGDKFISDIDGVVLFETRKEARQYRERWARFYRQNAMNIQPPKVVKVRVRVDEIKHDEKEVTGDD